MSTVRVTFFRAGSRVNNRRVRDFLGVQMSHAALEAGDWDLLWGAVHGQVCVGSSREAEFKRRQLLRGRDALVWGERYGSRDLLDVWLANGNARGMLEAARSLRPSYADDAMSSLKRLTGGASASAVAEVLRAGGLLGRAARDMTCDELLEELKKSKVCVE